MPYYQVNAGPLAVFNGAVAPLTTLFSLAELAGASVISGESYGQDYLRVPDDPGDRQALEELLVETRLIWGVVEELPLQLRGFA